MMKYFLIFALVANFAFAGELGNIKVDDKAGTVSITHTYNRVDAKELLPLFANLDEGKIDLDGLNKLIDSNGGEIAAVTPDPSGTYTPFQVYCGPYGNGGTICVCNSRNYTGVLVCQGNHTCSDWDYSSCINDGGLYW